MQLVTFFVEIVRLRQSYYILRISSQEQTTAQAILYGRRPELPNPLGLRSVSNWRRGDIAKLELNEYFEDFRGHCGGSNWGVQQFWLPENWISETDHRFSSDSEHFQNVEYLLDVFTRDRDRAIEAITDFIPLDRDLERAMIQPERWQTISNTQRLAVEVLSEEKGQWYAFSAINPLQKHKGYQTHLVYTNEEQFLLGWLLGYDKEMPLPF